MVTYNGVEGRNEPQYFWLIWPLNEPKNYKINFGNRNGRMANWTRLTVSVADDRWWKRCCAGNSSFSQACIVSGVTYHTVSRMLAKELHVVLAILLFSQACIVLWVTYHAVNIQYNSRWPFLELELCSGFRISLYQNCSAKPLASEIFASIFSILSLNLPKQLVPRPPVLYFYKRPVEC